MRTVSSQARRAHGRHSGLTIEGGYQIEWAAPGSTAARRHSYSRRLDRCIGPALRRVNGSGRSRKTSRTDKIGRVLSVPGARRGHHNEVPLLAFYSAFVDALAPT